MGLFSKDEQNVIHRKFKKIQTRDEDKKYYVTRIVDIKLINP
jgi:hypothetical protein